VHYYSFLGRLVSGAGDIKITKDGNVLLHEMVRQLIIITSGHFFEEHQPSFIAEYFNFMHRVSA